MPNSIKTAFLNRAFIVVATALASSAGTVVLSWSTDVFYAFCN